jgi:hypothetical protein
MNIRLLDNVTHTALIERMKQKICLLNDAVGNLFKFNNKLFIVTCKHVADGFFHQNNPYIILRDNTRIYSENLKYVASSNDSIDIALIEILNRKQINEYFETFDLQIIEDFNNSELENSVFFIFGFPKQLHFSKDEKEYIPWMSYMTIKSKNVKSDTDFLYLDYDRNSEKNILIEKELKTILPKAPGLSGALIFRIDRIDNKEIWHPSLAKAIAIQSTWNGENWIKGSNIKCLNQLLMAAN